MKVFVVLALLAVVAYAYVTPAEEEDELISNANPDLFLGELQDSEDGPLHSIGEYNYDLNTVLMGTSLFGIPSCKLGERIGNPICFAKCISRGNKGGYCKGKVCTCTN